VGSKVGLDAVRSDKSLSTAGNRTPAVHPIGRCYMDYVWVLSGVTYTMMQVVTRIPQFRYAQQDANLFRLRQLACLMFLVSLRSLWRETEKRTAVLHRRNAFPVAVSPPLAQIGSLLLQQAGSYVTANRQQS
jgi:hypothetical protein